MLRALLLTLAILLVFAGSAEAERAWVLWQQAIGPPTYESSTWIVSAWETKGGV